MLNTILGLRARGHDVDLACPPPPLGLGPQLLERARERGVEAVHLLEHARGYRPLRDHAEVRRLRALLREGAYDIVHVHHTRDHLLSLLAVRGGATRLVRSWHQGHPIPAAPWSRLLLGPRGATGLVVLSSRVAEHACRSLGWPSRRVAVVPGVVDVDRFEPHVPSERLRHDLGITPEQRVIGVVARLQPHRRLDLFVVLGRGTRALAVLHEPVAELGLEHVVVRAGYRRDDYLEMLSLFAALAFLVPGSDGSCRAVLEAMSMGIPAVVSRRGILPEIVKDRETGRIVAEDPEELASARPRVNTSLRTTGSRLQLEGSKSYTGTFLLNCLTSWGRWLNS
jgi:glycosyltransferase involved in cell wall biosynthesis